MAGAAVGTQRLELLASAAQIGERRLAIEAIVLADSRKTERSAALDIFDREN